MKTLHEANRMKRLPLYLFTILDDLKSKARAKGMDVIDLGMGNPDLPTPGHIVEALCEAAHDVDNHRYSRPNGPIEQELKRAIASWYQKRFGVELDPAHEVLPLIGAKEGIAHLSLAFLNNDDIGLVPNPAYPVHFNGVIMAGGILYSIPLTKENRFIPNLKLLSPEIVRMAKLVILSYPHNPTGQVVDVGFFEEALAWAKTHGLLIVNDLAYSDIVFDGYRAPSLLQVKGAKDAYAIEFHTLSKSYNMAGWRIGFAVGNREVLKSLEKTKSYIDFGIFRAVQRAAIAAMTGPQDCVQELVEIYRRRRDVFVKGLNDAGWQVPSPKATFYIWAHIPLKYSALTSMEFAALLVEEAGVAAAPGTGFGEYGEGYVRFALVEPEERLKLAAERIGKMLQAPD